MKGAMMRMMRAFTLAVVVTTLALASGCGTFSGKVVDQYNEPVPRAEVCVSYTTPSLTGCLLPFLPDWFSVVHHYWKTTRRDGTFRVVGFHGYSWRLEGAHGARKTGYEYAYPEEYDAKQNFYVIRMRKRLNPCFLHHEPYAECQFNAPGRAIAWDFIEREKVQTDPPKPRANSSWPLPRHTPDVLIDARLDTSNEVWKVTFRSPCEGGGFYMATNMVYEAPADGYVDHLTFSVPINLRTRAEIGPKCLVIRSRSPQIFTRLDVTYVNATERFFRLSFDAFSNPYGDRSLDIEPRIEGDYHIRKKLIDDSKKAWQEGHPPVKPNFETLLMDVKEFKER